ncbi:MFS transporter [Paenibacillus motobuensis]|uniref:MFS transporter n=1 Tax=Paenibacillus TaxID=44249 RepID=UPI00203CB2B6|nr:MULTISPECIES: MFS transporter [Paenibacillus]MCM3041896.1 MFS transporter [Paenibacillus lutimineralis]MCM3649000.1 MFS transporter [Paenibacillus motobuensis]
MSTATSVSTEAQASVWRNRIFTKMYTAYAISSFGDWFDAFAIEILVAFRWRADPLMIALIPVMIALPGILFGSFAGVIADRWKKVNLMMLADAAETLLTISLLFAPGMYWLLPLLALRATMGVFRVPAHQALTRQVVREDQLLKATSYNGLVNQFSKIVGPLLGAVALTMISPQLCILVNAVTRLISCLLLFTLRHIDQNEQAEKHEEAEGKVSDEGDKQGFISLWKQGWAAIVKTRALYSSFIVNLLIMLIILMVDFQFPTLYREIAPHNESLLGWMLAATGVGAFITILLLNRLGKVSYGFGIGGGAAMIGGALGSMGLLTADSHEIWSILLGFVIGIGNGLCIVTYNYLLQKETPEGMTGRIFGIQNMSTSTLMIGAPLIGGILIRSIGVSSVFFWLGLVVLIIGIISLTMQRILWPVELQSVQRQEIGEVSG